MDSIKSIKDKILLSPLAVNLIKHFKQIQKKIHIPYLSQSKANIAIRKGTCCVGFDDKGIILASFQYSLDQIDLKLCEYVACAPVQRDAKLSALVKKYKLDGMNCTWMLPSDKYQLLLLDELPVLPTEFQEAIRWKLKNLLSFPKEDTLVDNFSIPISQALNAKKLMMVAVTQLSYIKPIANMINESGLKLISITIPELGFKNITSLYENGEMSTALIYLQEKSSTITITRQKEFYFSRRVEWGLDGLLTVESELEIHSYLDRLALEIQRSFDYYQSQWRYSASTTQILLAPIKLMKIDIAAYLSQRLGVSVQNLNLNEVIKNKKDIDLANKNDFLSIIGGALHNEKLDYAPAN